MKNLTRLLPIALLCLAGCSADEFDNTQVIGTDSQVLKATIGQGASTRVNVKDDNTLVWTKGDAFVGFDASNEAFTYTLIGEGNVAEGNFEGRKAELNFAFYPASDQPSIKDDVMTVTLPAEYTYSATEGIKVPMMAYINNDVLSFYHVAGILRVLLDDVPEWVSAVTLKTSIPVSGVFTSTLYRKGSWSYFTSTSDRDTDKTVKVNFKSGTSMVYIPLPVGNYESIDVVLSNADGSQTKNLVSWTNKTVNQGTLYTASLTYSELDDINTPSEVTEALAEMLEDVSIADGEKETFTLNISNEITSSSDDKTITVPVIESANIVLNFDETPVGTSAENPLIVTSDVITEVAVDAVNEVAISMPTSAEEGLYLTINMPQSSVTVKGDYVQVDATTAADALILDKDSHIGKLVVNGGNITMSSGAEVDQIERSSTNSTDYTYIRLLDKSLRDAVVAVLDDPSKYVINIVPAKEYAALIDFYESMDGPNWRNNTGWNTETFVDEWFGLYVNDSYNVTEISFSYNDLKGEVPASIADFDYLNGVSMNYSVLTDNSLENISKSSSITFLYLYNCGLEGSFPEALCDMSQLGFLNLSYNNLTGEIPASIISLSNLSSLNLSYNQFDYVVPYSVWKSSPFWPRSINNNRNQRGENSKGEPNSIRLEGAVSGFELNKSSVRLTVGESFQVTVEKVLPEDAIDKSYEWLISDEAKEFISFDNGKITALKEGRTGFNVRALDGGNAQQYISVTIVNGTAETTGEEFTGENKDWK